MERCFFCKGRVVKKKVKHIHEWGEKIVIFDKVPAEVCSQCRETYFAPNVLEKIDNTTMIDSQKAEEIVEIPLFSWDLIAGGVRL